jgi:hypothetical protein
MPTEAEKERKIEVEKGPFAFSFDDRSETLNSILLT